MKKIQKWMSLALSAVAAVAALAGCSQQQKMSGTVTTDGSTSMENVIGALGEAFQNENSGVTFTYNPTGSGSGITAVQEGRCDIGLSSRGLKDEEAVKDGSYPIQRPFVLVTKTDAPLSAAPRRSLTSPPPLTPLLSLPRPARWRPTKTHRGAAAEWNAAVSPMTGGDDYAEAAARRRWCWGWAGP